MVCSNSVASTTAHSGILVSVACLADSFLAMEDRMTFVGAGTSPGFVDVCVCVRG